MEDLLDLIQECKAHNPLAQKKLYQKFSSKLMGICLRYTNCKNDAEDLLQEVFIKIFTKMEAYKGEGSFEGWIRRITVTTAIDFFHKKEKKPDHTNLEKADIEYTDSNNAAREIEAKELLNLIQTLPDGYRMVLNLYCIEGYSHKEISEVLNISEGTSKSQLSRARTLLAQMISIKTDNIYEGKK
ncbi:MAG: RNA polymerase sigma factor [Cytophagaceae bacterium]